MESVTTEIILGFFSFITTTLLGVVVYFRNKKSWTHRLFALLAIAIDIYIVVNFFSLHPPTSTPESQLFWVRVVMFITSFIGPILVLLVHTFPGKKIKLQPRYLVPLLLLMVSSALLSLLPFVFTSIHYPAGEPIPVPGIGMPIFFLDFVGLFILSFIILIVKYLRSEGENRIKRLYLLLGVLVSFSLMGLTTVVFVVLLKTSSFVFLGPIFPVILAGCIAYAIVRHGLFNIKIVASEVLVVVIWIVLFAKIFVSTSSVVKWIDIIIFVITIIFGIFLVLSVRSQVKQKDKLERLTKELASANSRLQKIDKAKTGFLSLASKRLREPLTAIKGSLITMLGGNFGSIPKELTSVMDAMYADTTKFIRQVNTFLNISRIETDSLTVEEEKCDLGELVRKVMKEFEFAAHEKQVELVLSVGKDPVRVLVDVDKISDALSNLIDNAIIVTDKGKVTIELIQEKGLIRVLVQDNGPNLSKRDIKNLLGKFEQSKKETDVTVDEKSFEFYVVRKIIDLHKGKVGIENNSKGQGNTFWFQLAAL